MSPDVSDAPGSTFADAAIKVIVTGVTSSIRQRSADERWMRSSVAPAGVRGASHDQRVPRISAFYGIVIWMYHDETHHLGRPHFHARYGDDEASIDIGDLAVIAGQLPPRALRLVGEWARAHQAELRENWDRARRHQPLQPIDPLR